jgi:hypothetical protein
MWPVARSSSWTAEASRDEMSTRPWASGWIELMWKASSKALFAG